MSRICRIFTNNELKVYQRVNLSVVLKDKTSEDLKDELIKMIHSIRGFCLDCKYRKENSCIARSRDIHERGTIRYQELNEIWSCPMKWIFVKYEILNIERVHKQKDDHVKGAS